MEWTSAKVKPNNFGEYLCVCLYAHNGFAKYEIMVVNYTSNAFGIPLWDCDGFIVTHWMPLPDMPEGVI